MAFLSPRQMIDELNIKPGSTVLDIGSGSGAYVYEVCRVNGTSGRVIAIDIDESKLSLVRDTAKMGGFTVETLLCDIERGIVLPDYVADYIIFANTLHQIEGDKRQEVLDDVSRMLAPMGEMLFVDWHEGSMLGPSKDILIEKSEARAMLVFAGLTVEREVEAGDYHYGFILKK